MSKNFDKNQRFGSLDVVLMIALLAIVATISQSVLGEVFADHRRVEARMKAESLAFRLASDSEVLASPMVSSTRAPASIADEAAISSGQIGLDPWGRPYAYQIKRRPSGKVEQVVVWSEGAESRIQYVFNAQ